MEDNTLDTNLHTDLNTDLHMIENSIVLYKNNDNSSTRGTTITISAPGTLVGATVGAIVFTAVSITGDAAANITSSGIELTGQLIGYGTELVAGSTAANTVKAVAKTYSVLAKPAITNASRIGAVGISLLAGTSAALATSGIVYSGQKMSSCLYSLFEHYKQKVANKIQHPVPLTNEIILLEDKDEDIQIIKDDCKDVELTHSHQDV
jgi:hypothetical protein